MAPENSIDFLGLRIDEPVTGLTDLLVTAICWYAYWKLRKRSQSGPLLPLLKYYFLTMGAATAIGGLVGHNFNYLLSFEWKLPGWVISMVSIALLERAAIHYASPLIRPKLGQFFKWLNLFELLAFIVIAFVLLDFYYVVAHSAYGLLVVVTGFSGFVYLKTKSYGSKLMLLAVLYSALGAVVYLMKWSLSMWMNHMDIGHLFMAASAYTFYRASLVLLDDPNFERKHR